MQKFSGAENGNSYLVVAEPFLKLFHQSNDGPAPALGPDEYG